MIFIVLVAAVYSVVCAFIQQRVGNFDRIKEIQGKFKQLNAELNEAKKSGDKRRTEEAMKKQSETAPLLMESMKLQFKPLLFILAFFMLVTFSLSFVEPLKDDDFTIPMNDVGIDCDMEAGDGIYSACLSFDSMNYSASVVAVEAFNGDNVVCSNSTTLFYNGGKPDDVFPPKPNGKMAVWSDKELYAPGDTAAIYAKPDSAEPSKVIAKSDNGTFFFVDLPFTIPILNIRRVIGPTGWFILCIFVLSIPLMPVRKYIR